MFSQQVAILCVTLVAVNAGALLHGVALAYTGNSVSSRHQDVSSQILNLHKFSN